MTKFSLNEKLNRVTGGSANIFVTFGAIGLLLMTFIIAWKVFGRYVLHSTPNWAEQSAMVLMIWYVSFAAAAGVKEGFHIRIVFLENSLSSHLKKYLRSLCHGVVAVCGFIMFFWGFQLVIGTWSHNVPTLGIPRGAVYIALPISGFLIVLYSLEKIWEEFTSAENIAEEEN